MNYIQVTEIGRCARELNRYPIISGRDPLAVLASELEFYWEHDAIIMPVANECDSYAIMRKPSLIGGKRVIRVRIIDVGFDGDETQEIETVELESWEVSK